MLSLSQKKLVEILTKQVRNVENPSMTEAQMQNLCYNLMYNDISENASLGVPLSKERIIEKFSDVTRDLNDYFDRTPKLQNIKKPDFRDYLGINVENINAFANKYTTPEGIKEAHNANAEFLMSGLSPIHANSSRDALDNLTFSDISANATKAYNNIFDVPHTSKGSLDYMKKNEPENYKTAVIGTKTVDADMIKQSVDTLDMMQRKLNGAGFFTKLFNLRSYLSAKSAMNKFKDNMVARGFKKEDLDALCNGKGDKKEIINEQSEKFFAENNKVYHDNVKAMHTREKKLDFQQQHTTRLQNEWDAKKPFWDKDRDNYLNYKKESGIGEAKKNGEITSEQIKELAKSGDKKYSLYLELEHKASQAKLEHDTLKNDIEDSKEEERVHSKYVKSLKEKTNDYLDMYERHHPKDFTGSVPMSIQDSNANDLYNVRENKSFAEKNLNDQKAYLNNINTLYKNRFDEAKQDYKAIQDYAKDVAEKKLDVDTNVLNLLKNKALDATETMYSLQGLYSQIHDKNNIEPYENKLNNCSEILARREKYYNVKPEPTFKDNKELGQELLKSTVDVKTEITKTAVKNDAPTLENKLDV